MEYSTLRILDSLAITKRLFDSLGCDFSQANMHFYYI